MPNQVPPAVDAESTAHLLMALAQAFKNDLFENENARQEAELSFDILLNLFHTMNERYQTDVWAKIDELQGRG